MHYFHEPLPHKSNQISILNFSLRCGSMSPINFAYHLKNLPLWKQSMNCFSQSIKNMPKNFLSLIGFLVGDCSYILILLVLSKVLTFVNFGILIIKTMTILTLFRMGIVWVWLLGLFTDVGDGEQKIPIPKVCHTYLSMMKLSTVIPYLKKIQKMYINQVTYTFSSAGISIFSLEINNFCYIKKYWCKLPLITSFLFSKNFFESLNVVLRNKIKFEDVSKICYARSS